MLIEAAMAREKIVPLLNCPDEGRSRELGRLVEQPAASR